MTRTAPVSYNPRTATGQPAPQESTPAEVDAVVARAAAAAHAVAAAAPAVRATWLTALAQALEAAADHLARLADEETALGLPRLSGELVKTAAALRDYGGFAAEGSFLDVAIDHANRGEGRPDLRRVNVALGPVAVFGASNFPFSFGVLGHDSASALAAGCPVIAKAHPAHPRLSAELGALATAALARAGAPEGSFGLVHGFDAGRHLVTHPQVAAAAFTGSQSGGLALWRLAAGRDVPIPVFAEMGTVNTVVVTAAGATARGAEIAHDFVGSFTLGLGQFCTKPGLLLAPAGHQLPARVAAALDQAAPQGWLLTEAIASAYTRGVAALTAAGATILTQGALAEGGWVGRPAVLQVHPRDLRRGSPLLEECFGPVGLLAEYADSTELDAVLTALPGSLVTGVQTAGPDDPDAPALVSRLARTAGRVVVDGWPTGVALGWAQQHGGPWPATSTPVATSVGANALLRFVRPVAFQDTPQSALPEPLHDDNPWHLPRRVDGIRAS